MTRAAALLFAAALLASGCARFRLFRPSRTVDPQVIGVVLPLSGPYQALGEATKAGIELALTGSSLRLEVRDSRGEAAAAVEALEELASSQKAIAVLGGLTSDEGRALAARADELGVPLITFAKAQDVTEAGDYVFQQMPTPRSQAKAIARYARCALGVQRVAVLAPEAEFAFELTRSFEDALQDEGGEVAAKMTYPQGQTTFRKEAQQLTGRAEPETRADYVRERERIQKEETDPTRRKNALEKLRKSLPPVVDFQGVFLGDTYKTVSLIAPALAAEDVITNACDVEDVKRAEKTLGGHSLPAVTLLGWSGWSSPEGADGVAELVARGGKYLRCAVFVDSFFAGSQRPQTRQFVARFRKAKGRTPGLLEAAGHDGATILRQVLEGKKPTTSAELRDAIEQTPAFELAMGTTSFGNTRQGERTLFFVKVGASGLTEVAPPQECGQLMAKKVQPAPAKSTGRRTAGNRPAKRR